MIFIICFNDINQKWIEKEKGSSIGNLTGWKWFLNGTKNRTLVLWNDFFSIARHKFF